MDKEGLLQTIFLFTWIAWSSASRPPGGTAPSATRWTASGAPCPSDAGRTSPSSRRRRLRRRHRTETTSWELLWPPETDSCSSCLLAAAAVAAPVVIMTWSELDRRVASHCSISGDRSGWASNECEKPGWRFFCEKKIFWGMRCPRQYINTVKIRINDNFGMIFHLKKGILADDNFLFYRLSVWIDDIFELTRFFPYRLFEFPL